MLTLRNYVELHGRLPFRLFKPNGTEIVLLPLDEQEENELLDALEQAEKQVLEMWWREMMHGA